MASQAGWNRPPQVLPKRFSRGSSRKVGSCVREFTGRTGPPPLSRGCQAAPFSVSTVRNSVSPLRTVPFSCSGVGNGPMITFSALATRRPTPWTSTVATWKKPLPLMGPSKLAAPSTVETNDTVSTRSLY